jgi:cytoskeleton protein RodZ
MTEAGTSVGPRLRAERERRGLSSQKAADELHLDGWVIDALEAGDYERIGPSVYAKGHLKRYASLLGLPAAEIMADYDSRTQAPRAPAPPPPANVRLRTAPPAVGSLPWPLIAGSVAAVMLAIGVLWWKPWHPRASAPVTSGTLAANPSAASADGAAESAASAAAEVTSPAPPLVSSQPLMPATGATGGTGGTGAAAAPTTRAAPSPPPDTMAGMGRAHLRLSFSADSWVDVHDAAGRRVFAGNGHANSVKTIAGIAPMRVYLGFASGVQLEINNRAVAIGPQFLAGDVARFEAGADGVLRRDSRGTTPPGTATPDVAAAAARPSG